MSAGASPGARLTTRPRGVIRIALYDAAVRLADERGGAAWRDIAAAAVMVVGAVQQRGVSASVARMTIKNMVKAGELFEVGREKPEGTTHWRALYAPALEEYGYSGSAAFDTLGVAMQGFSR